MVKKKDEAGEIISNKAGGVSQKDEKTVLIRSAPEQPGKDSIGPSQLEPDLDAERTRVVFNSKKTKKPSPSRDDADGQPEASEPADGDAIDQIPCVGWLVVWDGPGKGASHTLHPGNNTIGRDKSCDVALTHGDMSISSDGKISIDYEYRGHSYAFVNRGSKNTPYLNDAPIRTERELASGDAITIGETTLIFIPFCSLERHWS